MKKTLPRKRLRPCLCAAMALLAAAATLSAGGLHAAEPKLDSALRAQLVDRPAISGNLPVANAVLHFIHKVGATKRNPSRSELDKALETVLR